MPVHVDLALKLHKMPPLRSLLLLRVALRKRNVSRGMYIHLYVHLEARGGAPNRGLQNTALPLKQSICVTTTNIRSLNLLQDEDLKRTIDESARLERQFAAHFDAKIVNHAFDKTYDQLKDLIEATRTEPQWVPVSWVF